MPEPSDSDVHQGHLPPEVPSDQDKAATSRDARTAGQIPEDDEGDFSGEDAADQGDGGSSSAAS